LYGSGGGGGAAQGVRVGARNDMHCTCEIMVQNVTEVDWKLPALPFLFLLILMK